MLTPRRMASASLALLIGFAGISCDARAQGRLEVDLELILAVDVSRSMDAGEHGLQRDGYVAAFRHPAVLRAINSGPLGRIAVTYFEWAGPLHQSVAVPWTILDDARDLEAFANHLAAQPILPEAGTSISGALIFAERIFAVSGTSGLRRAIDISGDGPNNDGPAIDPIRQRLIANGVTINGLPIETETGEVRGDLTDYFRRSVIGGPRAFAITVDDKSQFAGAIQRKLVLEIAWQPIPQVPRRFVSAHAPGDLDPLTGIGRRRCSSGAAARTHVDVLSAGRRPKGRRRVRPGLARQFRIGAASGRSRTGPLNRRAFQRGAHAHRRRRTPATTHRWSSDLTSRVYIFGDRSPHANA